jgi:dynein heavy chain, axonemal
LSRHLLQGNILDDEELIDTLAQSKVTSNEIGAKVAEAERTETMIDETRELYRPVASRASLLFFAISDLVGDGWVGFGKQSYAL